MKRFFLSLILMGLIMSVSAQKVYFVYLQTETEQSFFVKLNDKVVSSAGSGYLILPKLRDSSYIIRIGFPQNKWPEQQFIINVRAMDHGYLLKNFGEKGWGLFDLQTLAVQMASDGTKSGAFRTEPKEVSEFTEVLSRAANDPSLKVRTIPVKMPEKEIEVQSALVKETITETKPTDSSLAVKEKPVKKPEMIMTGARDSAVAVVADKKKDSSEAIAKQPVVVIKDTVSLAKQETIKKPDTLALANNSIKETGQQKQESVPEPKPKEVKEEPKIPVADYGQSKVSRKSESSTTEGLGIVFTDNYTNGVKDTVRIVIPNPKMVAKIEEPPVPVPSGDKKILDVAAEKNKEEIKEVKTEAVPVANNGSDKSARTMPVLNNPAPTDCKVLASEKDYLKLRKKMVAAKTEQDMLDEGKKTFEEKCFSTEQVKGLGSLFLQEAVKFQFYEAAYLHNTDKDNFLTLESELKDPYFVHRFQNMVK